MNRKLPYQPPTPEELRNGDDREPNRYCPVHGWYDPQTQDHSGHGVSSTMREHSGCLHRLAPGAVVFALAYLVGRRG